MLRFQLPCPISRTGLKMHIMDQTVLVPGEPAQHLGRNFFVFEPTGCPAVDVTTLIAHNSLMPGPIIKPFDSMKVKTG